MDAIHDSDSPAHRWVGEFYVELCGSILSIFGSLMILCSSFMVPPEARRGMFRTMRDLSIFDVIMCLADLFRLLPHYSNTREALREYRAASAAWTFGVTNTWFFTILVAASSWITLNHKPSWQRKLSYLRPVFVLISIGMALPKIFLDHSYDGGTEGAYPVSKHDGHDVTKKRTFEPDEHRDHRWIPYEAANVGLLFTCFSITFGFFSWALLQAGEHCPASVLERQRKKTVYYLLIYMLCWGPYGWFHVYTYLLGHPKIEGWRQGPTTALQGFLNCVCYVQFNKPIRNVLVRYRMQFFQGFMSLCCSCCGRCVGGEVAGKGSTVDTHAAHTPH
jgi:hypothetical protein